VVLTEMSTVPSSRVPLARACGRTVGPGCRFAAGGAACEGALVPLPEGRDGYLRAAAPALDRAAFDDEPPMIGLDIDCI